MNLLLLKNSLAVGGVVTLLAVSLGLVAALCLAGLSRAWRTAGLGFSVVALALPPFLVTNSWLHFLGPVGVWRGWLPWDVVSFGGVVWILSLSLWPISMLSVVSAWHRLEPAQLESDMAVTGRHLFRGLLFPLARPALVQAGVLTFALALNNFAVPAILQVKTFPAEVWVRFNTSFDTLGALKMSWPLIAMPLLVIWWFTRRGLPWPHLEPTVSPALFRRQLGAGWYSLSAVLAAVLATLSTFLPLVQIVSVPRTWTELAGALAAGQSAIWNSFWLSAAAATLVIGLGCIVLTFTARPRSNLINPPLQRSGTSIGWLLWVPFLVPGVLLGIALINLLNHPWSAVFYQSAGIVLLALGIRYLGLGWNAVAHAAGAADRDLIDCAWIEGANWWQTFRHAYWPQIAPQAGAAWYIVFLLCLWDVESIILIIPPGIGETLALRIFNFLHYGHNAQVNALCLTLLFLALVPLLLWKGTGAVRCAWQGLHGSMRRLPNALIILGALSLCSGCGPADSSHTPLRSKLFSGVKIIGTRGVGVGQLNKPRSVAVDAQDSMYVVDMTGRVQKFSSNGVFQLSWQMPQTDLGKPKGMCRDCQGNIVVIEPHYSRVNHFSPDGKLVLQWGQRGTNNGQLSVPRAVAVDSKDEVFVTEYLQEERLQKFVLGAPATSAPATSPVPRWVTSIGKSGTGPGEFNRPEGVCVDHQDRVYVADSCNHRIEVFSSDGKFLRAYGRAGKGLGELSYPYDICVDADGLQYVCEFGNSRIQVFDPEDRPVEIIGGPGAEPGRFSNPWGVALDSAGNVYVADSQNHRVQKLIRRSETRKTEVGRKKAQEAQNQTIPFASFTPLCGPVLRFDLPESQANCLQFLRRDLQAAGSAPRCFRVLRRFIPWVLATQLRISDFHSSGLTTT